jgi:hypothetical protein
VLEWAYGISPLPSVAATERLESQVKSVVDAGATVNSEDEAVAVANDTPFEMQIRIG